MRRQVSIVQQSECVSYAITVEGVSDCPQNCAGRMVLCCVSASLRPNLLYTSSCISSFSNPEEFTPKQPTISPRFVTSFFLQTESPTAYLSVVPPLKGPVRCHGRVRSISALIEPLGDKLEACLPPNNSHSSQTSYVVRTETPQPCLIMASPSKWSERAEASPANHSQGLLYL